MKRIREDGQIRKEDYERDLADHAPQVCIMI